MAPAATDKSGSIVLFDGYCNLCNRSVSFIIARDPHGRLRFAALSSPLAQQLVQAAGATQSLPDSMVLIENGRLYTRSAAALRIAKRLRFPWPLLYAFIVIPAPLRNWLYDFVARNRYRWFGKRESCMVPTPELQQRFISSSRA
jgi:predicted DCC family thiol-disulfide oxidoreductase YuxK